MSVTPNGFQRPTLEELEEEVKANFESKFSDGGTNPVSLEPESFLGSLSSIVANIKDELYEIAEDTYFALFLQTATGVSLDRRAAPTVRNPAIPAVSTIDMTGTNGTIIADGFLVENENGIQYTTDESVTIAVGVASVGITAVVAGVEGNQPIGAIRFIPVPLPGGGLDTVVNNVPATGGTPIEADDSLRERAISERAADNTSSLVAIVNDVKAILNVSAAIGFENTTDAPDGAGRPPGSIEIVVRGGADQDIGEAIFASKSAGVETFGTETVQVLDNAGNLKDVNFSRVTTVSIFVEYDLVVNANYVPVTADPLIQQATLDYIGGVNPALVESEGVAPAEDVFSWKCTAALFELIDRDAIPGIENASATIGKTVSPTGSKVDILATEEAITDFVNIVINTTPAP